MANRVLLGNRSTGGQGIYVSKPGADVLTCAKKDLLLDSTTVRSGLVYAGASGLTLNDSADNFLTTGSKPSLGFIPLVVCTEKNMGARDTANGGDGIEIDEISLFKTTTSTITPVTAKAVNLIATSQDYLEYSGPVDGRAYDGIGNAAENAVNVSYMVLRIPCAYGYMNSTYFG